MNSGALSIQPLSWVFERIILQVWVVAEHSISHDLFWIRFKMSSVKDVGVDSSHLNWAIMKLSVIWVRRVMRGFIGRSQVHWWGDVEDKRQVGSWKMGIRISLN